MIRTKEGVVLKTTGMLFLGVIITVLILSLVSAGFWDSLKATITGRATSQTFNINISVGNNPPNITKVEIGTSYSPTEQGPTGNVTNIQFYFSANDTDGYQNINLTSARANFTYYNATTSIVRTNNSCVSLGNLNTQVVNFSCTIALWYFDNSGTNLWRVTAYVEDNSRANSTNSTVNFTYQSLQAFKIAPASFSFPSINPGATNTTASNDPLVLNNTGNYQFGTATLNITVNATDLVGESNSAYKLYAQNFTVGNTTGGSPPIECGVAGNSFFMNKSIVRNVTSLIIPYGNLSAGGGMAQEDMYFCLTFAGNDLTAQAYSTGGVGSGREWTVAAL